MRQTVLLTSALLSVATWTADAATDRTFVGTDGVWSADANWSPAGVPQAGDRVFFTETTTISNAVPLQGDLTIHTEDAVTLTLSGSIRGHGGLFKEGAGRLVLSGNNAFDGDFVISNGFVYARSPNALGDSAGGRVEVSARNRTTFLYLGGVHVRKNLVLRNCDDAGIGYGAFFRTEANTTNLVSGALSVPGRYLRMLAGANSLLEFTGGGSFGGNSAFLNRASGAMVRVRGKPISLVNRYESDLRPGWLEFDARGCAFTDVTSPSQICRGYRRMLVDNALAPESVLNGGHASILDLHGTSQTFSRLFGRDPESPGEVTTVRPASLTLADTGFYTNTCVFTGPVDLTLAGASAHPVTLTGASTSRGILTVGAGKTVRMAAGSGWRGGVVVKGALVLEDASALADAAFVDVWDGGSVTTTTGTLPAYRQTRRNGVPQPGGGVVRTYRGVDGRWTNPENWSPVGVPRTGDTAQFVASVTIGESFDLPGGCTRIAESASGVTVTLAGTVGGTEATVLHAGPGTLRLDGTNTFTGAFTNLAGCVRVPTIANIGEAGPLGAPCAAFATIYNGGTLLVTEGGSSDRPCHAETGAVWQIQDGTVLDWYGPVSGSVYWRRTGTIRLHAPCPEIASFARTDDGTVELLCPTNIFTADPFVYAGMLVVPTLAPAGEPSSIGAGSSLVFGQRNYTTPGSFAYSGWRNVACNRRIRVFSCVNATYAQKDGPCFLVRHPGVTVTYTGAIELGNEDAAHPFLRFDGAGDQVFSGAIPQSFHLYKTGTGTCTLAGANAATGVCTVAAGRLDVDGSLAAGMRATVASGATLGGSGTIHATVSLADGATLAAGASNRCGTLTFTVAPTLAAGTRLALKMGPSSHDCVTVPGVPQFPSAMTVALSAVRGERIPSGSYRLVRWEAAPATSFRAEGLAGMLAATPTGLVFTVAASEDFTDAPRRDEAPIELNVGTGTAYPTFAAARDEVRARRVAGTIPGDRVVVLNVAPGDYVADASLVLSTSDSGSPGAPVIWRAAERGTVRVLGASPLDPARFTALPTDDPLRARLDPAVAGRVVVADVDELLPETLPEWELQARMPAAPWFCRGGVFQDLARWPNRESSERFGWLHAPYVTSAGTDGIGVAFLTPDNRAARWNFTEGVWLYGYWGQTWNENFVKAASWNAGTREMVLAGRPCNVPGVGKVSNGCPKYIAVNVAEELDAPSEWWLDREQRRLYYIPPGDLAERELALVSFTGTLVTFEAGVHDVRFENIGFAYAGRGFTASGEVRRLAFDGCDFHSLVETSALSGCDNAVRRCTFRHLGKGGVTFGGGVRATLRRARNVVEDCDFTDFECLQQTYAPAVTLSDVGSAVRRCRISEAAHEGVTYGGNEHLVGWNEIHDVLRESEDCGAIYTGRNTSTLGTQIVGNSFRDLDTGNVTGIYFDDCDWGDDAIANTFTNVYRAFLVGGGNLHRLQWNMMKDGTYGLYIDRRGVTWNGRSDWLTGDEWFVKSFSDVNPSNAPWTAAYPRLVETLNDTPQEPWNNILRGNLIEDYANWTTLQTTGSPDSYYAFTNRMEIADNVTASTKGATGTSLDGFTHLMCAGTSADVPGMTAAFARIARLEHPDVVDVRSPDGEICVRVGLDVTARLCCRADCRGESAMDLSPMGVTVDGVDYGRMQMPCRGASVTRRVASGRAVDGAPASGYAEVVIPLEDAVRGGTNAQVEVRAFTGGFAWRMRVPGTGPRVVAGEVARWNPAEAGGFATGTIPTNAWTCTGEVETGWHVATLMPPTIEDGILRIDVPAGESRAPTLAERETMVTNGVRGVVKTGTGTLLLTTALTGYEGWWAVSNGTAEVSVQADAFGSSGTAPVAIIDNAGESGCPLVIASSATIARPVNLQGADKHALSVKSGVEVRFTKPVVATGKNLRCALECGGRTVFAGGFTDLQNLVCLSGGGTLAFEEMPAEIGHLWAQGSCTVAFDCPSNRLGTLTCAYASGGAVRLGCRDALAGSASLVVNDTMQYTFDLNGFDLEMGRFVRFSSGTLESGRPATLRFSQTSPVTNANCAVAGALSLSKTGTREFAVARQIDSTGGLEVDQGVFRMTRTGSWPSASFVRVLGTGRLIVEADDAFGEGAWVRIAGGGTIELADGVVLRCAGLSWNGRVYPGGSYSSAALSCIAGGGRVLVGPLHPTVLLLR